MDKNKSKPKPETLAETWQVYEEMMRGVGAPEREVTMCRSMFFSGADTALGIVAQAFPYKPDNKRHCALLDRMVADMADYKERYGSRKD